jgi:hypothetical protein
MAFIVKRDAVQEGIPVASKEILTVNGNFFYKRNTFNQFLGYCFGGGDVAYMGNGLIYAQIIDDNIYGMIVAPNANVLDNPDPAGNWVNPQSNWRYLYFYGDDGTRVGTESTNASTNPNYIPTSNWSPPIVIS